MRRIPIALAALVSALLVAPAAQAQEPIIRPGVTVAGVDVSNQTLSQAAGTIDRAFRHQLVTRNVSVRVGGRGYRLTTKSVGSPSTRPGPRAARSSPATAPPSRSTSCRT